MRKYTRTETLIVNLPYAVMVVLGAVTIAVGFGFSPGAIGGAASYLIARVL